MKWMPLLAVVPALALLYTRVIRPWQLRWGATDQELARPLPGDDLVARPTFDATRAVTVAAPPELVWPWLVQVGVGRAGWYSYDLLDNFGRPSATRIIPELQHLQPRDVVPFYQGIGAPEGVGLKVKALQPEQWVLWWDDKTHDSTWAWALYPVDEHRTRLITRVRMRYRWTKPTILFSLLVEFADLVMMRKCLLGIKQRAEHLAATPRDPAPVQKQ